MTDALHAHMAKLRAAAVARDRDAMAPHYRALLDHSGDLATLGRARVAFDAGDHEQALSELATIRDLPPDFVSDALLTRGRALLAIGAPDKALEAFNFALRDHPEDPDALTGHARALFHLRRLDDAEAALHHILQQHPEHSEAHYGLGVLLMATERLPEAAVTLQRAQHLNPHDEAPYRALATLARLTGAPERALPILEGALESSLAGAPNLMRDLIELHGALDHADEMAALLHTLEATATAGPGETLELGRWWHSLGDHAQVARLAETLGEFDEPGVEALLLGLAADLAGESREALSRFDAASKLLPDLWIPHNHAARLRILAMDSDEALDQAREALEAAEALAPQTAEVKLTRCLYDLRRGDPSAAADVLAQMSRHTGLQAHLRRLAADALEGIG